MWESFRHRDSIQNSNVMHASNIRDESLVRGDTNAIADVRLGDITIGIEILEERVVNISLS